MKILKFKNKKLLLFLFKFPLIMGAQAMEQTETENPYGIHHSQILTKPELTHEAKELLKIYSEPEVEYGTSINCGSLIKDTGYGGRGKIGNFFYWKSDSFTNVHGDFILDLGCGLGQITGNFLSEAKIVFNDTYQEYLDIIASHYKDSPGQGFYLNSKSFPDQTDFPANSFSSIWSSYLGHYLSGEELELGFKKMTNWLRPGGRLYYRVLSLGSKPFNTLREFYKERQDKGQQWPGYCSDVISVLGKPINGLPNKVHPHGEAELEYLAQQNGLKIVFSGKTHWDEQKAATPTGTVVVILQKPELMVQEIENEGVLPEVSAKGDGE